MMSIVGIKGERRIPEKLAVVVIGPMPPPLHGWSWVTSRFVDTLNASSENCAVIRTTSKARVDDPPLRRRVLRIAAIAKAYLHALNVGARVVYLPVSGGWGKILELPFVVLARLRGARIYIHHHSFAYINVPDAFTRFFFRVCGQEAVHVALGPEMADRLRDHYRFKNVRALSNACFMPPAEKVVFPLLMSDRPLSLGFLGNITVAKGINEFMQLGELLRQSGIPFTAHIAGPFVCSALLDRVTERASKTGATRIWGPVSGTVKEDFFHGIDILIFPTDYANEAEPVTILEALARGIPVMATPRGCIPHLLEYDPSESIFDHEDFAESACGVLKMIITRQDGLQYKKIAAHRRFVALQEASSIELGKLIAEMTSSSL